MLNHSKTRLLESTDPTYAPHLNWGGRNSQFAYWVAPKRFVDAGWKIKRVPLGRGDRNNVPLEMAARCRDLTREVFRWYEEDSAKVAPGTWHWLIARYKTDDISPINNVKANTREGYHYFLDHVDAVMGHIPISQTTYELLIRVQRGKIEKGRSTHHIHSWFSTLRRVARYGVLIGADDAERVAGILHNMRIPTPPARQVAATWDQVQAIVVEADRRKMRSFAAGILIQWWFGLRAVDVRGQYLDGKWGDGITWGMFDQDITFFEKVISKTAKSLPEVHHFDLTVVPGLRQRILEMRSALHPHWIQPHMPLALNLKSGKAYRERGWSGAWATLRKAAGVPSNVWCMDTRAGAITDASQIPGVSMSQLRNAAQHKDAATTGRYIRSRSDDMNRVVELRANRG